MQTTREKLENWDEKQLFLDSLINHLLGDDYNYAFRYCGVDLEKKEGAMGTVYHIENTWIKNRKQKACINLIVIDDFIGVPSNLLNTEISQTIDSILNSV